MNFVVESNVIMAQILLPSPLNLAESLLPKRQIMRQAFLKRLESKHLRGKALMCFPVCRSMCFAHPEG